MIKKILFGFLLLMSCIYVNAQAKPGYERRIKNEQVNRFIADSTLHVPRVCSPKFNGGWPWAGAVVIDTCDNIFYFRSGNQWRNSATGGSFVDSVYTRNDSLFYRASSTEYFVDVLGGGCADLIGGIVTWDSLLVFTVSPAAYCIDGINYNSGLTTITLDAADPDDPRIDAIILDASGVNYITGVPAANPAAPQIFPDQILLQYVLVPDGATEPGGGVQNLIIYDENTEWTGSATGSITADFNSTTNPFHLVKAVDVGAFTNGAFLEFESPTDMLISGFSSLKFFINLKSSFANNTKLNLSWRVGNTIVTNTLVINNGMYGFDRTVTGTYQTIIIPMSDFSFVSTQTGNFTLRIMLSGSNASGFYLDYIQLGKGLDQPSNHPNAFGVVQTVAGNAISTQPNDVLQIVGTGGIGISAAGKTVTIDGSGIAGGGGGSGISEFIAGYGLVNINDSTARVDTLLISTRAWRQKGDDSLGAIISTKVNISDTSSMLSNYLRGATEGWGINISGTQHKTWEVDSLEAVSWDRLYKVADSLAALGGGGYTNLTQFVDQTASRVFYSNADGDVTELALGADGTFLKSNGASSAPTWATPTAALTSTQVAYGSGGNTITSSSSFTWDATNGYLLLGPAINSEPRLQLNAGSGGASILQFNELGTTNWLVGKSAGKDFLFNRYNTSGVFQATDFKIDYSNGNLVVNSLKSGSTAPVTSGATKILVSDINGRISFRDTTFGGGGGGGGGSGISEVIGGYGLINDNDSTLRVDTSEIATIGYVDNLNNILSVIVDSAFVRTEQINDTSFALVRHDQTFETIEFTLAYNDNGDIIRGAGWQNMTIKDGAVTNAKVATGIDAVKIADGSVSNTEFQHINSVTSNVQDQLDGKQATLQSGVNIATVNGNSLLVGTNISISGSGWGEIKIPSWGITTNSPETGDSVLYHTELVGKEIEVYRSGELQKDSTEIFGYEFDSTAGAIIFHPVPAEGEWITIKIYPSSSRTIYQLEAPPGYDSDAETYFAAEEGACSCVIGTTYKDAVNAAIVSMKAGTLWGKTKALYFFFGSGLINARNPATFLLTTTNSPAFGDATGATFDGTNDYLNTNLISATSLATDDESHFVYVKSSTDDKPISGARDGTRNNYTWPRAGGDFIFRLQSGGDFSGGSNATSPGRYIISMRPTGTKIRVTKNNTQIYHNTPTVNGPVQTYPNVIGAINNQASIETFNACVLGLYGIGDGLSDSEMAELDGIISTFITATGRN